MMNHLSKLVHHLMMYRNVEEAREYRRCSNYVALIFAMQQNDGNSVNQIVMQV